MPDRETGFVQRAKLMVEPGVLRRLPGVVAELDVKAPAAIVDPALADDDRLQIVRDAVGARLIVRQGFEPTFDSIADAARELAMFEPDGVIAVGGGSTLDTAKMCRGLLASGVASVADLPQALEGVLPLVACPSTAGTGAEVGAGAIVYSPIADDKVLIRRQELAASVVLADGELTVGLLASLTAYTGLDAFAQALLAYCPAGPDSISGALALRAMRVIWGALPRAVDDIDDGDARAEMMLGSVMSAVAMFSAPPTYAGEHTFAEPVGAAVKCNHGHAVAAFLAATAEFNLQPFRQRYAEISDALRLAAADDPRAAELFVDALRDFVRSLGVRPLREAVDDFDLEDLIARCEANGGYELNPRPLTRDGTRAILQSGFDGTFALGRVEVG